MLAHSTFALDKAYGARKKALFSGLYGWVLELGPGAGSGLRHYPAGITLVGVEPNRFMFPYLQDESRRSRIAYRTVAGAAERLPFAAETFDAVVSTLVLCSVDDANAVLGEVLRVLRPGGRFLFIEHVAAEPRTVRRSLQSAVAPAWSWAGDGCRPDRDTAAVLARAGFRSLELERFRVGSAWNVTAPHIMGIARKAD